MRTLDALNYFDTRKALADAAGVMPHTTYSWKELVPEHRAVRIQEATNGALVYDRRLYQSRDTNLRAQQLLSRKSIFVKPLNEERRKDI